MKTARIQNLLAVTLFCTLSFTTAIAKPADPLPSWNNGAAKTSIVDFVAKVTKQGSPDYVAPAERLATFDNDGTLWAEQPTYFQVQFALDRVKALVSDWSFTIRTQIASGPTTGTHQLANSTKHWRRPPRAIGWWPT